MKVMAYLHPTRTLGSSNCFGCPCHRTPRSCCPLCWHCAHILLWVLHGVKSDDGDCDRDGYGDSDGHDNGDDDTDGDGDG